MIACISNYGLNLITTAFRHDFQRDIIVKMQGVKIEFHYGKTTV